MTKTEAIQAGAAAAAKPAVLGWGVCGFLIAIVTIPVAHFRSPRVPPLALAEHNDDATAALFRGPVHRDAQGTPSRNGMGWWGIGCRGRANTGSTLRRDLDR